ncbi:hypothetical protein ABDB91_01540 [Desulfoscipio sp. XC116]|uniref:beta strand repeat-containing protein n=1 Tax=Desulfoscipio sp. XC116 TaxID=3144975 RepID=UPI00325B34A0
MKRTWKRIGGLILSVCMMASMLPMAAFAETGTTDSGTPPVISGVITGFADLDTAVSEQAVEAGTAEEKLDLPDKLTATVTTGSAITADVSDDDAAVDSDAQQPETPGTETTVAMAVYGWTSDPVYDGNTEGDYVFTPTLDLPEGLTLAADVSAPTITVTVEEITALQAWGGIAPMGAGGPTEDGTRIYANGTPVVVKEVSGSTNMYLAADTDFAVPVFEDISGYVIYGGWESGDHTGDTSLTILSGTFNKTVYGGSRDGSIAGDTNLSIHDGTFTNHAYGGSALAGANVSGCANVTVENATFINSTLWGAGFEANTVGSTNVVIKDGSFLWAYGGGNEGSVTGTAKLTITGGSFSEAVFGGSDNASASVQNTEVAVANANIFYLYGGGWSAPVTDTAQINVEGGNLASLFGGGLWADVENVIVHIKGGTFHSEIFGGGLESDVTHDVSMTMEGGTFQSIFGSGNGTSGKGVVGGNVEMHLKAGTFLATIAPIGGIDSAKIDGNATIFVYPDALFGTYAELRTNDSFVTGRSAIKYAVDVQTNGGGTASASPAFAEKDEEVSLTASPNGGYAFKEWQVASGDVTLADATAASTTFTMPAEAVKLTAKYEDALTDITFTAAQTGGTSGTADSTGIELTFSEAVTGLTADKITITGGTGAVAKGTLLGSGTTWTLALSSVTTQGDVTINIADFGNFHVTTASQTVAVYKGSTPSPNPLAFTDVLEWDGTTPGKAKWNAVVNASGYRVQLYRGGFPLSSPVRSTAAEYDFTSAIAVAGAGSYTFKVLAVGDGSTWSDGPWSLASAAYNYTPSTGTGVTVGGVAVTSANKDAITGNGISGSVSYDPDTRTLTLNNASVLVDNGDANRSAILAQQDLTIRLVGSNVLGTVPTGVTTGYSIETGVWASSSDVVLTGSGNLTIYDVHAGIIGENITVSTTGRLVVSEYGSGLACCLKTDGGTLTVNSGTLVLISETSNALFGDSIVISGGTITALAKNAEGDGHFAFNSAPTFGANYRHSVYAGDSAATAQLVASPTAAIYTASKYVRIEPVTSGGGSSSGGSTTTPDTAIPVVATPEKQPNQPVTVSAPVTATAGTNGAASASIPEQSVTDAIAKAQADAKAQGKTANGTGVALNVTMPRGATALTATLTSSSLNSLVDAGVTSLELNGSPVTVSFDKKALAEIHKQSTGNISIAIVPNANLSDAAKTMIGTRPAALPM